MESKYQHIKNWEPYEFEKNGIRGSGNRSRVTPEFERTIDYDGKKVVCFRTRIEMINERGFSIHQASTVVVPGYILNTENGVSTVGPIADDKSIKELTDLLKENKMLKQNEPIYFWPESAFK